MSKNSNQLNQANKTNNPSQDTASLAGHQVNRIGFGAMQLPGPGVWGPPEDRDKALSVLHLAIELGVNHIDTAQFYGDGVSNELIHEALHPYPDDLVLVSKVGATRDEEGAFIPGQQPEQLRAGVEANLRSLEVEQVDIVNLRIMDEYADGTPVAKENRANLDDQLSEMIDLRDEGKIGAIGLSNVTLDHLQQALPAGIACVQNAYSLLDRSDEPLLELCKMHDIAWVPFFPLGSAFHEIPNVTEHPTVIETASNLDCTPAQVGLAWLLAHAPNTLLIPGTSNPAHLKENVASGDIHLDTETMNVLDAIADQSG